MKKLVLLLGGLMLITAGLSGMVQAQNAAPTSGMPVADDQVADDQDVVATPQVRDGTIEARDGVIEAQEAGPRFDPAQYQSILFTHWEHIAIQDARKYIGQTRGVTDSELARDLKSRDDPTTKTKPPPEEREIRLAGIVYRGKADWTIWLNEERVTPNAIPKEVMDLRVYKDYIEFKWFDDYTNQIFPIRLRPHQRFNIDTRIFLPG
ncbi:MAG: hypothetical protein H6861_00265 [Rhodospirillales bacterium]|nr:hypothetical protein [Rhodospirillales bacterium]